MRRTTVYTVTEENRDKGKRFFLEEMSATKSMKWAARAILALLHCGIKLPDGVTAGTGMAGLAAAAPIIMESLSNLEWSEVEPLVDEMMSCVQIYPDPKNVLFMRPVIEEDIEEVSTHLQLRGALLELHLGFSIADKLQSLEAAGKAQSTDA